MQHGRKGNFSGKDPRKNKEGYIEKTRALREASEAVNALNALIQHQPPTEKEEAEKYFSEVRRLVSVAYRPAMQALQGRLIQEGWTKKEIAAADKIAMRQERTRGANRSRGAINSTEQGMLFCGE